MNECIKSNIDNIPGGVRQKWIFKKYIYIISDKENTIGILVLGITKRNKGEGQCDEYQGNHHWETTLPKVVGDAYVRQKNKERRKWPHNTQGQSETDMQNDRLDR